MASKPSKPSPKAPSNTAPYAIVGVVLAALLIGTGAFLWMTGANPAKSMIGGPFALVSGEGKPVTDKDFRGDRANFKAPLTLGPCGKERVSHRAGLREMVQRAADVGTVQREGFKAGKADGMAGVAQVQGQKVQAGAKAKFCHLKAGGQPRGQVVSGQKDMARLGQPIVQREIRIIKAARHRDDAIAPV